jgi:hypothetical protein
LQTIIQSYNGAFGGAIEYNEDEILPETITELIVYGKMPSVILIQDSFDESCKPLDVPPVAITLGNYGAELRLHKVISNDQERWGMTLAIEDIYGEYTYSIFQLKIVTTDPVMYPLNPEILNEDKNIHHLNVAQFATQFIHKFVEAYKTVNDSTKDWIPEINVSRLSPWHKMSAKNFAGEQIWAMGVYDQRGTGVGIGSDLSQDKMNILQKSLKRNYVEDSATKYRQLANKYRFQKDFRTFCVFCVISFEHWIFREVRTVLLKQNKSNEEIDNLFSVYTRSGKRKNISREDAIVLVIGNKKFKNNIYYCQFIDVVLNKRDSIVHGRKEIISENDVNEIINIVTKLMSFLSTELHDVADT